MNFVETEIEDLYIVELNKIGDERGFFARAWCEKEFSDKNLTSRMVQANTFIIFNGIFIQHSSTVNKYRLFIHF